MKKSTWITGLALGLAAMAAQPSHGGTGTYYGVWWDGSAEHFVSIDPYTATKTDIAVIPDVQLIDATFRVFEPDSSRYAFVGGATQNAMKYQVINAPTGAVINTIPRTQNLTNTIYSPGDRKLFGLFWEPSDTTFATDSLGHVIPTFTTGAEYFTRIDPFAATRTNTVIPGLRYVQVNSHFLDTDSGRYVFAGSGTGGSHFYVIDVATGGVLATFPQTKTLLNPVYNSNLAAVHGLWWSDSSGTNPVDSSLLLLRAGAEYFVTHHADSTVTMVELPGIKYISAFNFAFDSDNDRYVFIGKEISGPYRYYVIDVATGAILSQTPVAEKIDHIVYAPARSTVDSSLFATSIAPSRTGGAKAWALRAGSNGMMELSFDNPSGAVHALSLHDVSGATLKNVTGIRSNKVGIETAGMRAGVYFFRLRNAKGAVAEGKLTVQ